MVTQVVQSELAFVQVTAQQPLAPDSALRASRTGAQSLLYLTGHCDPEGRWVPAGVGVHKQ